MKTFDKFKTHPFPACYDSESNILVLGSFPSPKSREDDFYYAHPSNRFWDVMSVIFEEECGKDTVSRRDFALKHHFALYDSLEGCEIRGSADSSIKNVIPANLDFIIDNSKVETILCSGRTSYDIYKKFISHKYPSIPFYYVPSTSALNASMNIDALVEKWKKYFKTVK